MGLRQPVISTTTGTTSPRARSSTRRMSSIQRQSIHSISMWQLLVLLLVSLLHIVSGAANIDTGGFTQDGKTTYCHGVHKEEGPLVFEELAATSIGKCPIDLQLTLSSSSIAAQTPLTVKWTATVHGGALATNLFPRAVDAASKKAQDVTSSLLRACLVGTNCAGAAPNVIEPAALPSDSNSETGAFDASGTKQLKAFTFTFPTSGAQYVIVGKISLPGDAGTSATEFVVFEKITVSEATANTTTTAPPVATTTAPAATTEAPAPATVQPAAENESAISTPPPPASPSSGGSGAVKETTTASASTKKGGINWQTVGIVSVITIVCALAFVLNHERRDLQRMQRERAYRAERTPENGPPQSPSSSSSSIGGAAIAAAALQRQRSTNKPSSSPAIMASSVQSSPRKTTGVKLLPSPFAMPSSSFSSSSFSSSAARGTGAAPPPPPPPPSSRKHSSSPRQSVSQSPTWMEPTSTSSYGEDDDDEVYRISSKIFRASEDFPPPPPERERSSTVALLEASPSGSDVWSIGSVQDGNNDDPGLRPTPTQYSFV